MGEAKVGVLVGGVRWGKESSGRWAVVDFMSKWSVRNTARGLNPP